MEIAKLSYVLGESTISHGRDVISPISEVVLEADRLSSGWRRDCCLFQNVIIWVSWLNVECLKEQLAKYWENWVLVAEAERKRAIHIPGSELCIPIRQLSLLCWCLALQILVTEAKLALHLTAFETKQKSHLCFRETCLTRQEKTPSHRSVKTCGLSNLITL